MWLSTYGQRTSITYCVYITQEFTFDINVEVADGALILTASFEMHAEGVNPAQTLADVSTSLNDLLLDSGDEFQSIASAFGPLFDSSADLFTSIAESDRITLLLNANLKADVQLSLSLDAIEFSTSIKELDMAFMASITDTFNIAIGDFNIHVTPTVQLRLQAQNAAIPFDVVQNPSAVSNFSFSGDFEGIVVVGIDGVPAEISLRAYSPYLTQIDSLEFQVRLDINLVPIRDSKCS